MLNEIARALLHQSAGRQPRAAVSHWALASDAATRLTISTFDVLAKDPTIGRAETLRRAMLAYLSDPSDDNNANPAYCGPFSAIGEGTAK